MSELVPPPGPHGGDGPRVAAALGFDHRELLDLSLSLNPLAPDLGEVFAKYVGALGTYPDVTSATWALAQSLGVEPERVLLTNGGAQAIELVAGELGGYVEEPEFSLYPRGRAHVGPRWRSNPHSPSGQLVGADDPEGVWDEAFYPLATGVWTRGDANRGAVVVGSLTKVFACPGLRAGYVIAPDAALIERLRRRQPEWSVNGLAAAALPDLLALADLASWAASIVNLRARLVAILSSYGLEALPSDANWVLVEAPGLRRRLAPHGVLVRDCSSFGLAGAVRIAVPSELGLARLGPALEAASQEGPGLSAPAPARSGLLAAAPQPCRSV